MAQENQVKLEDKLLQIDSINKVGRGIEKSKSYAERSQLYLGLANLLSEGNPQRYKEAYGDIRISPEEAMRYVLEGTSTRAKNIEGEYKQNKGKIAKEVVSSIKDTLKEVKNKSEAASILSQYFTGLFETKDLDQITADEYAQEDAARELGVSMNFSARGSIEQYKQKHESLQSRLYASQFLKDKKDNKGNIIGYELDKDKIVEVMDKVVIGATLYSNSRAIEKVKEEQKQKEAKKKAS